MGEIDAVSAESDRESEYAREIERSAPRHDLDRDSGAREDAREGLDDGAQAENARVDATAAQLEGERRELSLGAAAAELADDQGHPASAAGHRSGPGAFTAQGYTPAILRKW